MEKRIDRLYIRLNRINPDLGKRNFIAKGQKKTYKGNQSNNACNNFVFLSYMLSVPAPYPYRTHCSSLSLIARGQWSDHPGVSAIHCKYLSGVTSRH